MRTAATALIESLTELKVRYVFVNLGSDHPAILEALSEAQQAHSYGDWPKFITCPNEMVGLAAAQGFAQVSGQMQAVLVHVDAGTLSLSGAIHNVARARIPVLILAGMSPITQSGSNGSRNEFIHYLQDTLDQRGIVRGYMKYDNEIRMGSNIQQMVYRAAQFAQSQPTGPVYLTAAREVLEQRVEEEDIRPLQPALLGTLPPNEVTEITTALARARMPIVVTSYLGRNPATVSLLVNLAEMFTLGVLEAIPGYVNFPSTHPLYQGSHWSEGLKGSVLYEADVILVIDCDVPWIQGHWGPQSDAKIYHIDCDPLKTQMGLFGIGPSKSYLVDSKCALEQLVASNTKVDNELVAVRHKRLLEYSTRRIQDIQAKEQSTSDSITPEFLISRVRELVLKKYDSTVLSEGISNYRPIVNGIMCDQPGQYFTSNATSLGWHGGASIGAKLAAPSKTVIAMAGDGSYLFSIPLVPPLCFTNLFLIFFSSTVHWMSKHYHAPFLTIIFNNRGWKSPMLSALACYGNGSVSKTEPDDLNITFDPPPDHAQVAVAAGAGYGRTVKKASEIDDAINEAIKVVHGGRSAVLDVWLPKFNVNHKVG